jgi:hypothetical protein
MRFNQIRGKKSRWLRGVSQFVTLHPAACGRQVSWSSRQSMVLKKSPTRWVWLVI